MRYRAEYTSDLDRRHKTWELGVHRDKAAALVAFNEMSDRPAVLSRSMSLPLSRSLKAMS